MAFSLSLLYRDEFVRHEVGYHSGRSVEERPLDLSWGCLRYLEKAIKEFESKRTWIPGEKPEKLTLPPDCMTGRSGRRHQTRNRDMDVNGALTMSAPDKRTERGNKIPLTNGKGRLSRDNNDRMATEAELCKAGRDRIGANNGLESCDIQVKLIMDDEKMDKLSDQDREDFVQV